MPTSRQPEILPPQKPGPPPRFQRASGLFADENLDFLSHVLDDWFRVPGTSIRFGLDGIIGLVPGLGDIIGGLASTILVLAAWVRGVPYNAGQNGGQHWHRGTTGDDSPVGRRL